jgi:pilus assembly protein CpaE
MTILCEPNLGVAAVLIPSLDGGVRTVTTLPDAAMTMATNPAETLVVIGPDLALELVVSFARHLHSERPEVSIILLRHQLDQETVAVATGAGVRRVVPYGDSGGLASAVSSARTGYQPQAPSPIPEAQPQFKGQVVTVFSAKGGTGKTTLATNLAVALNASSRRRVCLVDLDLAFGDVAISMNLTPARTLIDAVGAVGIFEDDRMGALITPFGPGLDCVLAPVEPGDAEKVPSGLVSQLLRALRRRYEFVVIDTPSQFSEHVLEALDGSQHHVLLTTPEIPSLKNLRLTLDMLDLLSYDRDQRTIVLNRSDARGGLSAADIQDAIKSPIDAYIPTSHDVPASINRGIPLTALQPDHAVSRAIRSLADNEIVDMQATTSTTDGRRSGRRGLKMRTRSA